MKRDPVSVKNLVALEKQETHIEPPIFNPHRVLFLQTSPYPTLESLSRLKRFLTENGTNFSYRRLFFSLPFLSPQVPFSVRN